MKKVDRGDPMGKKILLSVAGYDPTSGAGILLDLKVFHSLGFQGMALLTSVTSQNTRRVKSIHPLSPPLLWDQYKTLHEDISFSGIKVGMVGSIKNMAFISRILSNHPKIPKVVDPVFRSSSGKWLLEKESIASYVDHIKGRASLLTPNTEEASLISGITISTADGMKEAAERIYKITQIPCLIKGGHLAGKKSDVLFDGKNFHVLVRKKIKKRVHGTGCFLSSSLLAFLAKGNSLKKAFFLAEELTHDAIARAIKIGSGQQILDFF